jgi:hypothetical protein
VDLAGAHGSPARTASRASQIAPTCQASTKGPGSSGQGWRRNGAASRRRARCEARQGKAIVTAAGPSKSRRERVREPAPALVRDELARELRAATLVCEQLRREFDQIRQDVNEGRPASRPRNWPEVARELKALEEGLAGLPQQAAKVPERFVSAI